MLGLWKGACLIYIIYVSLRIVLSNTNVLCFCFVFLRLVYLMLPILWIVPILIASLVFSNVLRGDQNKDNPEN
jgi:phosphoglycerol transferase MdoB-like AlkP superfamily enzyme